MKKILLSVVGIFTLGINVKAQTWTFSSEPTMNASTILYLVDTASVNYASAVGSGQTWDYSMLGAYQENSRIVAVEDAINYAETFPIASHVQLIPGFMNTAYTYEETTNHKMSHGYQFEFPDFGVVTFVFEDLQKMLEFPSSFGAAFTDDMAGTLTIFEEDNYAEGTTWVTVDGSGTLVLSNGVTHNDVLRIHSLDTLYADITLTILPIPTSVTIVREQFDYVKASASAFPLFTHATLKILNPIIGEVKVAVVLSSENPEVFASVSQDDLNPISLYPNPSNGIFKLDLANSGETSTVTVINVAGSVVYENTSSEEFLNVDLSNQLPGIYFVQVVRAGSVFVNKVILR